MASPEAPTLSDDVSAADWIRERLSPWDSRTVTSVVPSGFESYIRILHPVQLPREGVPIVRWADVSRWSGVPLHPRVQWHEVALPETIPATESPWRSQGPSQGTLFFLDADVLIEDLTPFTSTPQGCYFCLWIGYMGGAAAFVPLGSPPIQIPAPPQPRRLVELPEREYGLFEGPLADATSLKLAGGHSQQTPNLWWPEDHSWCVASEIDLPWTYVGGSSELIDHLLADGRLETVSASPDDPLWIDVDGWLSVVIEHAVDEVLSSGSARLTLAAGTVTIEWQPARWRGRGMITARSERSGGWGSHSSPVNSRNPDEMRRQIALQIRAAVLNLVGV
ncbi:MAG TPA: hypothetical protein VND89_05730 [Acidimicrobiales bacterium]|nr:hypothetical protein [Acidimicrobiales bacterium]